MGDAKRIVVQPIDRKSADECVKRWHYSGKTVNNSQLHLGAFLDGKLLGAMQFGPSLDKRKIQGLVEGTGWNEFIELNRMAFSDALPRNSESRCLAVAMRLMRKHAPHIKWVVSFADGAQCGDGTIYRASGFVLTSVKTNAQVYELTDGFRFAQSSVTALGPNGGERVRQEIFRRSGVLVGRSGASSLSELLAAGARPVAGFQLRYLYFVDPTARERLTVPVLPFDTIDRMGAGMYRGEKRSRVRSADSGTTPQE